jgi:hypothetical protein
MPLSKPNGKGALPRPQVHRLRRNPLAALGPAPLTRRGRIKTHLPFSGSRAAHAATRHAWFTLEAAKG